MALCFAFEARLSNRNPRAAAVVLPIKMLIFPRSICWVFVKARLSTNIAIVKPIPPNIPAPNSIVLLMLLDRLAIPNWMANRLNRKMPTGLPINNPKKIPKLSGESSAPVISELIVMAVFESANNGRIR